MEETYFLVLYFCNPPNTEGLWVPTDVYHNSSLLSPQSLVLYVGQASLLILTAHG